MIKALLICIPSIPMAELKTYIKDLDLFKYKISNVSVAFTNNDTNGILIEQKDDQEDGKILLNLANKINSLYGNKARLMIDL